MEDNLLNQFCNLWPSNLAREDACKEIHVWATWWSLQSQAFRQPGFCSKQLYGANFPDHPSQATAAQSTSCFQNAGGMSMKNVRLFLVPFINYFSHFSSNSTSLILPQRQGEGFRRKQANNQCSLRSDEHCKPFLIVLTSFFWGKQIQLQSQDWFL